MTIDPLCRARSFYRSCDPLPGMDGRGRLRSGSPLQDPSRTAEAASRSSLSQSIIFRDRERHSFMRPLSITAFLLSAVTAFPAAAREPTVAELGAQLARQQELIEQLQNQLAAQAAQLQKLGAAPAAPVAPPPAQIAPVQAAAGPPPTASNVGPVRISGLDLSGDLRFRQEWNFRPGRDRSRQVVRARIRANYEVSPHITIGGQLVTGDPDDPNSADITLSNFADDFNIAFDQAWVRYANGPLALVAGKFPQPFMRTDLVWDGDVSPQGIAATYVLHTGGESRFEARGIYFAIDEAASARDSDMLGAQLLATAAPSSDLKLTLAAAYYHYRLGSVAGADSGDFRSNLFANGHYLSEFHLLDGIASINWNGLGERWPILLSADVVRNLGATVSANTGFNIELTAGRSGRRGDWRLAYNYSRVGVDAVFAAFSNDNLEIATNYELHGFGIAHNLTDGLLFDLAYYHYRPLDPLYAGAFDYQRWLDRVRLNLTVSF